MNSMFGALVMGCTFFCLFIPCSSTAADPLSAHMVLPSYRLLHKSNLTDSALYEVLTPQNSTYSLAPVLLARIRASDRVELGRTYSELLGGRTVDTYTRFMGAVFPNATVKALFELFADWLWKEFASPFIPEEFHRELDGMRSASPPGAAVTVDTVARRMNVLANLPAGFMIE